MAAQVLVIEDNDGDVRLIEDVVAHGSVKVKLAVVNNCAGALRIVSNDLKPHLVIADFSALEFGGVELMKLCNSRSVPVILFGGSTYPPAINAILRLGAKEFVEKPITLDDYSDAVWKMIQKWAVPKGRASAATNDG